MVDASRATAGGDESAAPQPIRETVAEVAKRSQVLLTRKSQRPVAACRKMRTLASVGGLITEAGWLVLVLNRVGPQEKKARRVP